MHKKKKIVQDDLNLLFQPNCSSQKVQFISIALINHDNSILKMVQNETPFIQWNEKNRFENIKLINLLTLLFKKFYLQAKQLYQWNFVIGFVGISLVIINYDEKLDNIFFEF